MRDSRISIVRVQSQLNISRSLTTFAMAVSELCKGRETGLEIFKQAYFSKDDSEPEMQQLFPNF